jgi:hypothetical protein
MSAYTTSTLSIHGMTLTTTFTEHATCLPSVDCASYTCTCRMMLDLAVLASSSSICYLYRQ